MASARWDDWAAGCDNESIPLIHRRSSPGLMDDSDSTVVIGVAGGRCITRFGRVHPGADPSDGVRVCPLSRGVARGNGVASSWYQRARTTGWVVGFAPGVWFGLGLVPVRLPATGPVTGAELGRDWSEGLPLARGAVTAAAT